MIITMSRNSTHGTKKDAPEGAVVCVNVSGEDIPVSEFTLHFVILEIPHMLTLIDTIGHSIAEAIDECIQARFGGVGLPTAIKYLQEVITHSGNMVAVQVYTRLVILGAVNNTGVSRLPVAVVSNCVVHLLFDLTHEMVSFG